MEAISLPEFGNTSCCEDMTNYLFSEDFKCPVREQWKHIRVKSFPWVPSERACEMSENTLLGR